MEHATDRGSRKTGESTAHENDVFAKFHEILTLVRGLTMKIDEFSSLARISLLRDAAVHYSSVS